MNDTSQLKEVTDNTFGSEVLSCDVPVVVDFWSEWCQPCKNLMPILVGLSAEYGGRVKFLSVNVEDVAENAGITEEYTVRTIPTLIFFKEGQAVELLVGLQAEGKIKSVLNKLL